MLNSNKSVYFSGGNENKWKGEQQTVCSQKQDYQCWLTTAMIVHFLKKSEHIPD
jgi:hypothetical protein